MTNPLEDKSRLRTGAAKRRKRLQSERPDAATSLLSNLPDIPSGASVAGYSAIHTEIDPAPLMAALHARGHPLCLPVIERAGRPLSFRQWEIGTPLVVGQFGASIPVSGDAMVPEILFIPLLAFDRHGFRLGYGGGFYDRTLEWLRGIRPVGAFGLAYAGQEVECVPTESTDQRLDAIVTEAGLIKPREVELS